MSPTFNLERDASKAASFPLIIGVDEAGCGPWAGPLVACAVSFSFEQWDMVETTLPLNDSKKLSPTKRVVLFQGIKNVGTIGMGIATVEEIDTLGLASAHRLAVFRAVDDLLIKIHSSSPPVILMDGIRCPRLPYSTHMIVKGDSKSCSIAAASIIAKVTRDGMMHELSKGFPHYGWDKNAGYGTKRHQEALHEYGVTRHHRTSYAPIKRIVEQGAA